MSLKLSNEVLIDIINAYFESTMTVSGEFRQRSNKESPERVERAKALKFAKIKSVDLNEANQVRVSFDVASSDGKGTYNAMVVIPGLLNAYKENPKPATIAESVKNSDVKVKCECKDFHFRYEYYLSEDGSLAKVGGDYEAMAVNNAPNVTNPNNDIGPFCKHLIKVTSVFAWNISNIRDKLNNIDLTTISENKEKASKSDDGEIILEKEEGDFTKAIIGTPEELEVSLQKDTGLEPEDREEITEILLDKDDGEVSSEESEDTELTVDAINEIEPDIEDEEKITGAIQLDKDSSDINLLEEPPVDEVEEETKSEEVILDKDKNENIISTNEEEIELDKDKD